MARRLASVSVKVGLGFNHMTPEQFARLPVNQRIDLLMKHNVEFLDEQGKPMDLSDAIDQLPKVQPPSAPPTRKK